MLKVIAKYKIHSKPWWKSCLISLRIARKLPCYIYATGFLNLLPSGFLIQEPDCNGFAWAAFTARAIWFVESWPSLQVEMCRWTPGASIEAVYFSETRKFMYHWLVTDIIDLEFALWKGINLNPSRTLKLDHTVTQIENCHLKCVNVTFYIATTFLGCMGWEFSPVNDSRMNYLGL